MTPQIPVAGYCRVSTDKDDQLHSFHAQCRYFQDLVERTPEWSLFDLYADEGITGTSTQKRAAFNRMIEDAERGCFRLILTKEVSRFSRNILDTIAYTRQLKALGVTVLFLNDGIHTLDPDAELRLSIMGSLAQEESRKTSVRVKWGQTRQMERGVVFGRSLLGYDVKDGRLTINSEGAALVRRIFSMYAGGSSLAQISAELEREGYHTSRGKTTWSRSHLFKLLQNEKYVGDLVQKKSFTPDYLTHQKKTNHGEETLIVLRNHHEAIIDRVLWEQVQLRIRHKDRNSNICKGNCPDK